MIALRFLIALILLPTLILNEINAQVVDTSTVLDFYEKGKTYFLTNADSTEYYYAKGLQIAKELDYHKGVVTLLRSRGGLRVYSGRNEAAYEDLRAAIEIVEKHELPIIEKVNCLINIGAGYSGEGKWGLALAEYIEAEELARQNDFIDKRGMLLNNIAISYKHEERYEEALGIYNQAVELRIDIKDSLGLANTYYNLATCYTSINDAENQLLYVKKARVIYEALGREDDVYLTNAAYGEALIQMGQIEEGVAILDDVDFSRLSFRDIHVPLWFAHGLSELKKYDKSEEILKTFADDLVDSDYQEYKAFYHRLRFTNLSAKEDYKKAYAEQANYIELTNDLSKENTAELRKEMEEKYLSKQKDLTIELKNIQLEKSTFRNYLLIFGLIAAVGLTFLFYRLWAERRIVNKKLEEQNLIISKALSDKELLLKEIHHRVKNNLQFISALLGLQTDHVSDEVALGALQEGQDRVQSMALIHQDLYQRDDLTSVNMKQYFVKLIEGLFDSYNIRPDSISLDLDIDELNLDVDSVVPLGLIVNEIISNSLKYAFKDSQEGRIKVSLSEQDNQLHLVISDNGVGMTDEDKENLGSSLGYKLVKALSGQLEGAMDISTDKGTQVSFSFEKYQKSAL